MHGTAKQDIVVLYCISFWKEEIFTLLPTITKEYDSLKDRISDLQNQITSLPDGHLLISRNGKYIRFAHYHDGTRTYISKKNRQLIEPLVKKKYLTALLTDSIHEQQALHSYLDHYQNYSSNVSQILDDPIFHNALREYITPFSDEIKDWANAPYKSNPYCPEQLRHTCLSGNNVRSKSEVFIDQALFLHGIPYRYECALSLDSCTIYPDFTIRHPHTGRIYYWEHFGMMDNPEYARKAFQKMQIYNENGILPSDQLIMTFENQEHPFRIDQAETVVSKCFL